MYSVFAVICKNPFKEPTDDVVSNLYAVSSPFGDILLFAVIVDQAGVQAAPLKFSLYACMFVRCGSSDRDWETN